MAMMVVNMVKEGLRMAMMVVNMVKEGLRMAMMVKEGYDVVCYSQGRVK